MENVIKINTNYLKTIIKDKGLKLSWVAQKVGIDRSYLYLILTQKRNPSSEIVIRLLNVLGVGDVRAKSKKDMSVLRKKS